MYLRNLYKISLRKPVFGGDSKHHEPKTVSRSNLTQSVFLFQELGAEVITII